MINNTFLAILGNFGISILFELYIFNHFNSSFQSIIYYLYLILNYNVYADQNVLIDAVNLLVSFFKVKLVKLFIIFMEVEMVTI